ncbi:hypothetical protein Bca101_068372 [Brassica carinata]
MKHPIPPVSPLNADIIPLRTDAAWRADSLTAGLGCIISRPVETLHFTEVVQQVHSALMGEALAMRMAILKCNELGLQNIRCESDSKLLINSINNGNSIPELYGVVADILRISANFVSIVFVWISRKKNMAADLLAKQCLNVGVEHDAPL